MSPLDRAKLFLDRFEYYTQESFEATLARIEDDLRDFSPQSNVIMAKCEYLRGKYRRFTTEQKRHWIKTIISLIEKL